MQTTKLILSLFSIIALAQAKYLCTRDSYLSIVRLKNPTKTDQVYTLSYSFSITETTKDRFGKPLYVMTRTLDDVNYPISLEELTEFKDVTKTVVHFSTVEDVDEEAGTFALGEKIAIHAPLKKAQFNMINGNFDMTGVQPFPFSQKDHACDSKDFNIEFLSARFSPFNSNEADGTLHLYFSVNQGDEPYTVAKKAGKVKPYFDDEIEELNKIYDFEQFDFFALGE